ncbi:recombinase family protein [Streptomyces althioticus]|uniref:recombinase family protein n=1 Tax=Streptomyces althioticus TaxID=83380 RepID=UPI003873273F|nr:recombinase family protein [Streptomyces althioticus]WTB51177.1 recombinase family protein [Streptomyces althioticus]
MTTDTESRRDAAPVRAVLYVCAEQGLVTPTLGAERAEQEGRAFAAARGMTIVETVTDPYGQPDPMCRKGWRRVRELARRGETDMIIVRWPTAIAPDHVKDLRHREIDRLLEHGVSVRYSWAPLSQQGTVR